MSGCNDDNVDDDIEDENESGDEGTAENQNEPLEPASVDIPSPSCEGYVLCIDNVDMNVRPSFQRVNRTTESYHFCHAYAAKCRLNTSGLQDGLPSGTLSSKKVLPCKNDIDNIQKDFEVLVSR